MSQGAQGSWFRGWFSGAAVVWLAFAALLFALSFIAVPLHDPRFQGASATLTPYLWLPTLKLGGPTLLHISAVQTGLSLIWAALGFAVVEAGLAFYYQRREEKLVRPLVRMVEIFLVFWSCFGHLAIWDALLSAIFPRSPSLLYPRNTVIGFAEVHLELVIVSSIVTVFLGLALGILVTRAAFAEFLPLVSNFVSAGQTLPTIAVVAIMVPIIGFGFWPTVIALIIYGMLPVLRNTIAGLEAVDSFLIDSARGMGMTPLQILLHIELPNASSIILAGVRTSVVINVGTAALGAYAGSGGLGVPIAGGLSQNIFPFVLEGAIPAALLAILIDYILGRVEFVLTPKGLQIEG
jgi:osmoprotectant transport system permease protein